MKLKFQSGNAKLSNMVMFSLPAGHSCPFAKECMSRANKLTGKIIDGQHCRYRCFAAMEERYPAVRKMRWTNFNILRELKTVEKITAAIVQSLPMSPLVRIHPSGDFFNERYFLAWMNVAYNHPLVTFYAYTKAIPTWLKYRKWIPKNFRLVASYGGTHDILIKKHNLRYTKVVFTESEAQDLGLELDHNDSLAYMGNKPFALLLHGSQPAGTPASSAWYKILKTGGGYSSKKKLITSIKHDVKIHITLKGNDLYLPFVPKLTKNWWTKTLSR